MFFEEIAHPLTKIKKIKNRKINLCGNCITDKKLMVQVVDVHTISNPCVK